MLYLMVSLQAGAYCTPEITDAVQPQQSESFRQIMDIYRHCFSVKLSVLALIALVQPYPMYFISAKSFRSPEELGRNVSLNALKYVAF
jgi:hypothetical protein